MTDHQAFPGLFRFTQQSLQDYVDCPRRFQLRYVLRQPWPAFPVDPPNAYRDHLQRGADFHRMAHQYALGLNSERLAETIQDPMLASWWQTFVDKPVADLPDTVRRPETLLGAPLAGYRLAAKYDLLAADPGERFVVVDWKTVLRRPHRSTLARRLQTRVYRYLAVESGAAYNDAQPPRPEQVEMVYWFAAAAGATERFQYDAAQHRADKLYLVSLIGQIVALVSDTWPLSPDDRQCRWCNYRSLCERDVTAGALTEVDVDLERDQSDLALDLEQIAEIEF